MRLGATKLNPLAGLRLFLDRRRFFASAPHMKHSPPSLCSCIRLRGILFGFRPPARTNRVRD